MLKESDDIQKWKRSICAGNECFDNDQTERAIEHYRKAINIAENLFYDHKDPDEAVAILIVSHHNLADVYLRKQCFSLAESELRCVHQKLSLALSDVPSDSPHSDALLRGVNRTYFALSNFTKEHPNIALPEPPRAGELNHKIN